MVELALSMAIIAFAMVAIMGVLPAGLQVQKANREDTIINQEGAFFLEAIKNGSMGYDQLVDYVDGLKIARTNYFGGGGGGVYPVNTDRGFRIIGRLSTPKYEVINKVLTVNTITAKIRPLTGAASHKGATAAARAMSLSYLLQSEVIPYAAYPTNYIGTNYNAATTAASEKVDRSLLYNEAQNLAGNLYEIRLTFRWPVYELRSGLQTNWTTGPNIKTFRTLVSGKLQRLQDLGGSQPITSGNVNAGQSLYFFRPFIYSGL